MKRKSFAFNFIASAALTMLVIAAAAFFGDFYFDLNDDVFMKDILSGAYTGTPEGHNIQMLYPVSAFIALFYRVIRGFDWYGFFLCACQFLCVFAIIKRVLTNFQDKAIRVAAALSVVVFMLGGILSHFVFVQYTFTCGFLSATAAFIIMTHQGEKKADHILAIILIVLAYLIRSEMLLLTLPIVGVGILIKYCLSRLELQEYYSGGIKVSRYGERKKLFKKYVLLCVSIVLGLAVSTAWHRIAYISENWREFNDLFDARTELYDFQYIPDYDENREFYDSIALSEPEQRLLINYNFGIDDEIDTHILREVAKYADRQKTDEIPLLTRLVRCIPLYLYRLKHVSWQKSYEYPMTDAPLNILAGIMYLGAFAILVLGGEKKKRLPALLLLMLLFACRSTLWLYIIVRGRDPIRITHPLYIMEIAVLLGIMLSECKEGSRLLLATLAASIVAAALFIPNQVQVIGDEMAQRDVMRNHYDALYEYFDQHPESFYFVDVYTSVSATDGDEKTFSEKMFENVDNSFANHDIMGGWASKSPLYYKKLEKAGYTSMQEAILKENVYIVSKTIYDVDWLFEYYLDKGQKVDIEQVDQVTDAFAVYKVSEAG